MSGPVNFTDPAPPTDVAALIAAGAQALAEHRADADRIRAEADRYRTALYALVTATVELQWATSEGDPQLVATWADVQQRALSQARELL